MKSNVLLERPLTGREAHKSLARRSGALVGFEFEFAVPEDSPLYTGEDLGETVELSRLSDFDELEQFFTTRGYHARRMDRDFSDWVEEQKNTWVGDNWEMYADDSIEDEGEREADAIEKAQQVVSSRLDLSEIAYVHDVHGTWYELISHFDFEPRFGWAVERGNDRSEVYTREASGNSEQTREAVANALSNHLDTHVSTLDSKKYDHWKVVPDGSIEGGHDAEIVSPPLPWADGMTTFNTIVDFAVRYGLLVNSSTGLHVNISVPDIKHIDIVKFVVFLGDEFALQVFNRANSTFARSQGSRLIIGLKNAIGSGQLDTNAPSFAALRTAAYAGLSSHKYNSVNISKLVHEGYLEIRIAGGDYIYKGQDVLRLLNRLIIALDIAMDPHAEKKQYAKKLAKAFSLAQFHVNPEASMSRQYLFPLVTKTSLARAKFSNLSGPKLPVDEAYWDAIALVKALAVNMPASQQRLTFAQAAELFKLFKRQDVSIAKLTKFDDAELKSSMKKLGLTK